MEPEKYHILLEKQLDKFLPASYLSDEKVMPFLNAVSNAYRNFEKDKKITEHAFAISEREYQEVMHNLRQQSEITRQSILQLKQAITSLDETALTDLNDSDDNLINIIGFLHKQILKTKELEAELIQAKELAENAARAKSDFLSVMSHEIRTPLNAIIGYIHLLQHEDPQPSQIDFLRILQISADNLLTLINDILDFSKIEEGKIVFSEQDIDIRQLVNNIRLANRLKATEKGNALKLFFDEDIPATIKADEVRLTQVLNNLLSNAIKFTQKGTVTIEVQLESATDEYLVIYFGVKDTGVGIAKEKQHLIFERFTQENSNITREYGGSGLGLAIIRKLLQMQDSEIHVESEPGKGSKFYFTLKFRTSDVVLKEAKKSEVSKPDLKNVRVLLVDDVEFNVMLGQKMLSNWNAEVTIAENGLIALEKMRNEQFDIVLMDLQMPVMDGFTSAIEIRKFNTTTPIVALTASTSLDIKDRVFASSINDYISKPLNPSLLYDKIVKHTIGKKETAQ